MQPIMKQLRWFFILLPFLFPFAFLFSLNNVYAQGKPKIYLPTATGGLNNLPIYVVEEIVRRNPKYEVEYPYDGRTNLTFSKVLADLEAGDISVIGTLASREYEERFQAIYYPLYMGIFGLRLAIVKKSEVNQFQGVRNLEDLKAFKAGQGKKWADTPILKSNGIPVVEVNNYFRHFPMLEGDRFDYFPRAIHEPWGEIEREKQYDLTVDPHILLRYQVPFYLFISKNDRALYNFLVDGMEELVESGRLREMFFAEESVQMALANSNLENRVIIDLHNPELSSKTPINRPELWYDPLEK